jgi:predicted esterase
MGVLLCSVLARPAAAAPPATAPASSTAAASSHPATAPASQPVPADFQAPPGGWPADANTGAINKVALAGVDKAQSWFHLAVPKNYSPQKAWPLMIVLHGGPGGQADDIVSFFRGGLTAQGVISVYPQAMENRLLDWNHPDESARLIAIIRQVARTYRIDPCRIYLVGCSMGGGGAWANGAVLRDIWAGIGPIAGWYAPSPAPPAEWLKGMPIYCLHGQDDAAVPVSRARLALEEMKKIGHDVLVVEKLEDFKAIGKETFVYREVPGGGHNVLLPWQQQGSRELAKMIGWLLAQKRPAPADIPAAQKSLAEWGKRFGWTPDGVLGKYAAGAVTASQPGTGKP